MRVLFAFAGGQGHFDPLVPLVRAAAAAATTSRWPAARTCSRRSASAASRRSSPRAASVVSHAGSGSVLGALAHGLPLPIGADQPHTAARAAELGAAVVLDPVTATPEQITAAVRQVLDDPAYAAAAHRIREEIRALPPAMEALARFA